MTRDFYLSYSGRKTYLSCPLKYKLQYIDKIPGVSDPKAIQAAVFGLAISRVFEWFYERRIWIESDVIAAITKLIEPAIDYAFEEKKLDQSADTLFSSEIKTSLIQYVLSGIEIIRSYKLLSPDSRAEVKLNVNYQPKDAPPIYIAGRADFIHRFENSIWILDGKSSVYREKYVDVEQLIWYAVQFYLKYHISPNRLGFVYWRFPQDPVQWIAFDDNSLRNNLKQTLDVADQIRKQLFDAHASDDCRLCDYHTSCGEGIRYIAAKRIMSGGKIENSIFDLELAK